MNERINPSRRQFLTGSGAVLVGDLIAGPVWAEKTAETMIVDEWLKKQVEDAALAMRFRGSTAEECKKWQAEFAAKLRSLLGPHAPPSPAPHERLLDRDHGIIPGHDCTCCVYR
jgi:hypothetical protein